jgi:hypothetical protein
MFRRDIVSVGSLLIPMILAATARADDPPVSVPDPSARPAPAWTRVGPLGDTPRRVTDAYPLSDQEDAAGWVRFGPMSDEFDDPSGLDAAKWTLNMSWWLGRQPALFSKSNVEVSDGALKLTMRREKLPAAMEAKGYRDYTSAALHTSARSRYGYFEIRARPMNSAGSSSFWFQRDAAPDWATEIDVFEIGGKAPGFERKVNMALHVFRTPAVAEHWQVHGVWEAPSAWPTTSTSTASTGPTAS